MLMLSLDPQGPAAPGLKPMVWGLLLFSIKLRRLGVLLSLMIQKSLNLLNSRFSCSTY